MPCAVIYVRVSTEEQAERGLSLRAQEETCRRFAGNSGWLISSTFRDEGLSASLPLDRRPGLVGAVAALGSSDCLLIAKRDRIFRADPFTCAVIERAVFARGARIVSAAGEGTTDDEPSSVLMRRLLDAFGEYERLLIVTRTNAVMASKRARGERIGQIPFGSRLAADGKTLEPDPEEQSAICWMRRLRTEEGRTLADICRELSLVGVRTKQGGGWTPGTVARILGRSDGTK